MKNIKFIVESGEIKVIDGGVLLVSYKPYSAGLTDLEALKGCVEFISRDLLRRVSNEAQAK